MHSTPDLTITQPGRRLTLRSPRLLLLDSDDSHANGLAEQLSADDIDVIVASSGVMAASRLRPGPAHVVVVRADLAEGSGYAAIERLRAEAVLGPRCPVIAVSERATPDDRLRAFRRGCVDFIALPLNYAELHARIGVALNREAIGGRERAAAIEIPGGLLIDPVAGEVSLNGTPVKLTRMETDVLMFLAREPDRIVPKAEMLAELWGITSAARTRTLDSHACRLRSSLAALGGDYVHNRWGIGYRLLPFPSAD